MRTDDRKLTTEKLERAVEIAAEVVDLFGDTDWPIYDLLDAELELRKSRAAKLAIHRENRERRKSGALSE